MTQDDLIRYWGSAATGLPQNYAFASDGITLGPAPDSDNTVTMTYVRTLTPSSEFVSFNWLLEKHPDLYLYASLVEAEARGWNDERAALLNSRVDGILDGVNQVNIIWRTTN